jgi:hypothetical protein
MKSGIVIELMKPAFNSLAVKAAHIKIHANVHENFENVFEFIIVRNNQKEAISTL